MSKKKVLSVDICGTCYERFEGADPQESAAKLKAHYWWTSVSNPKDEDAWKAETRTVLEKFAGHRVVNVDAHI